MSEKKNPIDVVMQQKEFSNEEATAFKNIIKYAKLCQQGQRDNLQSYINEQVEGVAKNEIQEN